MDKITRLKKEISSLKERRREANEFLQKVDDLEQKTYAEICKSYKDFYTSKRNKEFVLYDRFPSHEALEIYCARHREFPLFKDGELNAKELTEIIKHLYQFETGKEYEILTVGATELHGEPVYGGQAFKNIPHLFFMIGNAKTLAPFKEYNGMYVNSDKLHTDIYLRGKAQNLITIETDRESSKKINTLGITCSTGDIFDMEELLNYYDECEHEYTAFDCSAKKQIFSRYLPSSLNYAGGSKIKGIKDVFDFIIHPFDSFIARVLISIVIYKRNNGIDELTDEDYNHIFDSLYGEKVTIKEDVLKDIPKQLQYVPSEKSGR